MFVYYRYLCGLKLVSYLFMWLFSYVCVCVVFFCVCVCTFVCLFVFTRLGSSLCGLTDDCNCLFPQECN